MSSFVLTLALLAMACLLLMSGRGRVWKACVLSLLGVLLSTWWFIDRLSGDGLNAATLYHLRAGMEGAGVSDFAGDIAAYVALLLAALLPLGLARVRRWRLRGHARATSAAFVAAAAIAITASPLPRDGLRLYRLGQPVDGSVVADEYRVPRASLPTRKNIVWIYGESLERTYFDRKAFAGLTPNLQRLAAEGLDFRNVTSADGGGWTIAGMVSSQCGVPLTAAPGDENSFGRMHSFLPEAQCLGDYLRTQGYRNDFIGGADGAFAGKGSFLASHGYDDVRDLAWFEGQGIDPRHFSAWGVHDDVLLDQVWDRFQALSRAGQPFMLTTLTMDTHHPAGHLPVACRRQGEDEVSMRAAIACSDRLIGELVDRIRASRWADDTVVVIASDHLALPNELAGTLRTLHRENLLLMLGPGIAPRQVETRGGSTLDSGATLLSLLDPALGAIGFGRSLLDPHAKPSGSAAFARADGRDFRRYLAYANQLWTGRQTRTLRVHDDRLVVGVQELRPPVLLDYDSGWNLKNITLEDTPRRFRKASPENTLAYVDRCTAFDNDSPDSGWCALLINNARDARLYRSGELAHGVRVDAPLQRMAGARLEPRQPVMVGSALRQTAPGHYQVTLTTSHRPSHAFWIEAMDAQGKVLAQHWALPDPSGRIEMSLDLDREVDDMQIRAWLGSPDDIGVNDDVALVRAPTRAKRS
ncbi:phosphoglycerol transferase I [Pseudoxanthomonas sp. X-1]|uniref:phosphoglycerol transferase I n=1 Tax=Pseudoxanthomonas sp. X-1 TaxID=2571115 RepID=UPI00110A723E|nr:phosphoglycerol transferase I [Pseudoxanthomonas sp. X-1]TMN19648.1 phosphoglycerol transferase I [Pseudoxanthomonas sp. X-1]UAY74359.1 phosphoglycerol transferase I [Pseudoxanthomonas sp. X-1]